MKDYKVTLWSPGEFSGYSVLFGDLESRSRHPKNEVMKDSYSYEILLEAGKMNIEATVGDHDKRRGVTHLQLEYVGK